MPRPRLEAPDRRDAQLRVRLTAAELAQLHADAERAGRAFPDFVRERVLTGRVTVEQGRVLAPEVWIELRRLGVNLNQIARALNTGREPGSVAAIVRARAEEVGSLLAGMARTAADEAAAETV